MAMHNVSLQPRDRGPGLYRLLGVLSVLWATLFSVGAQAQQDYPRDLTASWTNPSEYIDATLIQDGDLRGTRIQCERHDGTIVIDEEVPIGSNLPGDPQSFVFVGAIPQPGTYTCLSYAVTIDSIFSDASNPATRRFTGKPLPPSNLTLAVYTPDGRKRFIVLELLA